MTEITAGAVLSAVLAASPHRSTIMISIHRTIDFQDAGQALSAHRNIQVIHLEGEFWDENGLRPFELEEYRISEKKASYQLNDESISGKGLKFCYPNVAKDGKKQKQYILNNLDFNMEYGKAIGLIGLKWCRENYFCKGNFRT